MQDVFRGVSMAKRKWTLRRIRNGVRRRGKKYDRALKRRAGDVLFQARLIRYEPLYQMYSGYFDIGVAAESFLLWNDGSSEIGNVRKEQLIRRCFSSITCENSFKPYFNFNPDSETLFSVHPAAEAVLQYAKKHHLKVRLHTLVWTEATDLRIFCKDCQCRPEASEYRREEFPLDEDCLVDREELIRRLKTYIYGALEYIYSHEYAENVAALDVVNEAVGNQPDELYTDSYWLRIIGPEYIYFSFRFARDAVKQYAAEYKAPQIPLFLNEYNEWEPEKMEKIFRVTEREHLNPDGNGTLLSDGLVDGIGLQCHVKTNLDVNQYLAALREYGKRFKVLHITEMDIIPVKKDSGKPDPAELYGELFRGLRREVKHGLPLASVTVWGLTDDRSWLRRAGCSLLFDSACRRKKEFNAIVNAAIDER